MIEPEDLFNVGDSLYPGGDPDEAHRRSAISRYYYGCHLLAARITSLEGDRGDGTHGEVINALRQRGARKLATDMDDLRKNRNLCDYKIHKEFTHQQSRRLKNKAKKTKQGLHALRDS